MKIKYKVIVITMLLLILGVLLVALSHSSSDNSNGNNVDLSKVGNVSVTVTGDVMFGRNEPNVLSSNESPFRYVSDVIDKTDVLLVNFENPATTSTSAVKPDVPLKCDPIYVPLLKANNNTIVAAGANNHVYDYGKQGLDDTIKNLDSNGITHIGVGENVKEASAPAVIEKNGHKITILNYMDGNNFAEYGDSVMPKATSDRAGYSAWDPTESPKQIEEAKRNGSDFVLVYMHYGNEYSRTPNEDQKNISYSAIDAGADAVVGSHAHVTQGMEMYNGKPIFYCLGNFIFDQSNTATHRAYFVNFHLDKNQVNATIYPVDISGYLPQHMSSADGKSLLEELTPQCNDLKINDDGHGQLSFKLGNNTTN